MTSLDTFQSASTCIEPGVAPLLTELAEDIDVALCRTGDDLRPLLQGFVQARFRRAYDAEVTTFCPGLLVYSHAGRPRAVVGYRDGMVKPLFSERYLDAPAERLMSKRLDQPVLRRQLAEVGNLALAHPGQARWLIAATTAYLHAAGYRWVLFTAVKSLSNAFARLGLRPLPLAVADPARLPDGGRSWGRYYAGHPLVYAGDIAAGMNKLAAATASRLPQLKTLMNAAARLGAAVHCDVCNGGVVGGTG